MNSSKKTARLVGEASPRLKARVAGVFELLEALTSGGVPHRQVTLEQVGEQRDLDSASTADPRHNHR